MQLTRGQKDALSRKAFDIVSKKRADMRSELVAHWKPNKETREFLSRVAIIQNLLAKLNKELELAGFSKNYNSWNATFGNNTVKISVFDVLSGDDIHAKIENSLMNSYADVELDKRVSYPTEIQIMDEIELLNITKDFDVEKFLAKYKNL